MTIWITGSVNISGEISLEGTSAVLKNITIDGNSSEAVGTKKSLIYDEGSLTIEDGTVLRNNALQDLGYFKATGGAIRAEEGTITMTGGTIENNSANYGGGVYLYYHAGMTMSGGVIRNNTAVDGTSDGIVRICRWRRDCLIQRCHTEPQRKRRDHR